MSEDPRQLKHAHWLRIQRAQEVYERALWSVDDANKALLAAKLALDKAKVDYFALPADIPEPK